MREEIIPKIPEKYGACCKKFGEPAGIRETFQSGQKYGSLSKDLCHPEAIVWCSAKIPTGQPHSEFQQISLSSSHQDPAIWINTAVVFQEMWQRAVRKKGTISAAKCQGTQAGIALVGRVWLSGKPFLQQRKTQTYPTSECHSWLPKLLMGIIPFFVLCFWVGLVLWCGRRCFGWLLFILSKVFHLFNFFQTSYFCSWSTF